MSKNKTKRSLDLIEDITVEELRKDGLVEEVAVSDGTSKKDEKDTAVATDAVKADAQTKASIDASASKEADADEHVGSGPGATVPPSAENDKAVAAVDAANNAAPTAEAPKTGRTHQRSLSAAGHDEDRRAVQCLCDAGQPSTSTESRGANSNADGR